jgi:hypothetical protein
MRSVVATSLSVESDASGLSAVVKTGARAARLCALLVETGLTPAAQMPRPKVAQLPTPVVRELMQLYCRLGGLLEDPALRPGKWDLAFDGSLMVELDEELHFNRYRAATLGTSWSVRLPWADAYRLYCEEHEARCVSAGSWGQRWTNESAARMFSGGPEGDFDRGGAPRWKQRALYDALKDTVVLLDGAPALARVATHERIGEVSLGAVLDGLERVDPSAVRALVEARACSA